MIFTLPVDNNLQGLDTSARFGNQAVTYQSHAV